MGKELEYKLQVEDEAQLLQILNSEVIASHVEGQWRRIPMETTYYDNAQRRFAQLHWTFRYRLEGETGVVCLKTPCGESHTRNEWQTEAGCLNRDAVKALLQAGAPQELLQVYDEAEPKPICGAKFLRRCAMLRFADGTLAELAGDIGQLYGQTEFTTLSELELELYEGSAETLRQFAIQLCQSYHLHEQPRSKFARAKSLK